ncbi:hypothetical protein LH452_15205 [Laribacter hongkongensis]|uniref:hypothetical protein n=1 Tax=Laribacter hongkongensis TaxID=168471 RepID=UPI001EFCD532|nr:hypothetical protein [Laribacter hongkongensis]MCG9060228.1 hypothetical protein [Laribacter hongkongensis]MCG9087325.1 hypothetical protein [Laribacter hongkongensis]
MTYKLSVIFHDETIKNPVLMGFDDNARLGLIEISVKRKGMINDICLFRVKWDINKLYSWADDNYAKIANDSLPENVEWKGSIIKSINYFYDSFAGNDSGDDLLDKIYEYRTSHNLVFAFRGVSVNDLYIGKVDDGFEVSGVENDNLFSYKINIESFFESMQELRTCRRPPGIE